MLFRAQDSVKIFIVFLVLQTQPSLVLCGIFPLFVVHVERTQRNWYDILLRYRSRKQVDGPMPEDLWLSKRTPQKPETGGSKGDAVAHTGVAAALEN